MSHRIKKVPFLENTSVRENRIHAQKLEWKSRSNLYNANRLTREMVRSVDEESEYQDEEFETETNQSASNYQTVK